jgi:putative phosphoribosyl transferase
LPVGLFGASTGAAAALMAAAKVKTIGAVVSRGGRPDLATGILAQVRAPTLLIVGGEDLEVLALNRLAMGWMTAPAALQVIAGAGHLFEEPGALREVAGAATRWFRKYLVQPARFPPELHR